MQFVVQLIKKQYEKFRTHEMNQRFFPEEFYHAHGLAIAALKICANKKINEERINKINKFHKIGIMIPLTYATKKTDKKNYNNKEEYERAMSKNYQNMRETINSKTSEEISKDMAELNEFFKIYKDIVVTTEKPNLPSNQPGVIGIGYQYMSYNKQLGKMEME